MMSKPKLRVAVLVNSYMIPAWAYSMLERIQEQGNAEFVLTIKNKSKRKSKPARAKLWNYRRYWLYFLYRWFDERFVGSSATAFKRKDIRELLPDLSILEVTPIEKKYSDYFSEDDLTKISASQPDVMIRLGFRILRGKILSTAKYGIWSYHHGDNRVNRGGPPAFWECFLDWHQTGSILQVLSEDLDNGFVLHRSWSGTYWYSPRLTNEANYWKTATFIPRKLQEVRENGWESVKERAAKYNVDHKLYSKPLFSLPGNWKMISLLTRRLPRMLKTAYTFTMRKNQWFLMYNMNPAWAESFRKYKTIDPPRGTFWADPFIIRRNDRFYVFFEEYAYSKGKAHISVFEMDDKGNRTDAVTVLEKDHHLSYPFVFEHEDKTYMIPEGRQKGSIELYECTDFPHQWELKKTLMKNVQSLDNTVLFHDGRWWLFTNMREFGKSSPNDELFLFSSEDLITDEWEAHPDNPIVSDARRARPAGRIFWDGKSWIRPSQDCGKLYGFGFNLSRINILSRERYEEELIESVTSDWDEGIKGTHSFAREGNLTIIDAVRTKPKSW